MNASETGRQAWWKRVAAIAAVGAGLGALAVSMPCVVGCGTHPAAARDGAPAGAVEQLFVVEGMTCGGCAVAIRTAVEKLDGVVSARADHKAGRATVVYDPHAVKPDAIVGAIERLGYKVVSRQPPHAVGSAAEATSAR